jgi:hypothetical protein
LHISDIHYSQETNALCQNVEPIDFERKDWAELSDIERKKITPHIIRTIKKQLYDDIENENFISVILTGDLCDKGNINAFDKCLEYLTVQFHNFSKRVNSEQIYFTAGNHDINSRYDPENLQSRFENFLLSLRDKNFKEYSTETIFEYLFEVNGCKILLLDINSCFEFGNILRQPDHIRKYIQATRDNEGDLADLNKILNVPYIRDAFFDSICEKIINYPDHLPIIYTHHNLFPMRHFVEGKEYDGILNCGSFQERLYSLKRPVLFIHGHVHDNPTDIHVCPESEEKIIFISAPLFFPIVNHKDSSIFGYNIININFSDRNPSIPLSCELHKMQFDVKNGVLKREKENPIPFYDSLRALPHVVDIDQAILYEINGHPNGIRLNKLMESIKSKEIVSTTYTNADLVSALEQLRAIKLIQFRENESDVDYSTIKGGNIR